MSIVHQHGMTAAEVAALEAWAERGDFEGIASGHALIGAEARAAGRAALVAAGVDVDNLRRSQALRTAVTGDGHRSAG